MLPGENFAISRRETGITAPRSGFEHASETGRAFWTLTAALDVDNCPGSATWLARTRPVAVILDLTYGGPIVKLSSTFLGFLFDVVAAAASADHRVD